MRRAVERRIGRTLDGFNVVGSFGSNGAIAKAGTADPGKPAAMMTRKM